MYRRLWLTLVFGCDPPALTDETLPPPCADGGWGAIGDPADTIHVQAGGDDTNDGSAQAPLLTVSAAIDAARDGTPRIGIGPGSFEAALDLLETDGGLVVVGCSPEETILVPEVEGEPQIKVTAALDVEIGSLTLSGGDRGLWVWGGAAASASHVVIDDGQWSGFVVDGPFTLLDLEDVSVTGTRSVGGVGGYGGEIDGAVVTWTGGGAWGNTAVGVVVSGETADLQLSNVEIADTLPADDGAFGRGVQVQEYASARLSDTVLSNNHDAGLFSLLGDDLVLERVTVDQTAGGAVGGDGIVVTGVDAGGRQLDPATFVVTLDDNVVTDPARAGIVLERVTATVSGNQVTGGVQGLVSQEGAVVSGPDVVDVLTVPLVLNRDALGNVLSRR